MTAPLSEQRLAEIAARVAAASAGPWMADGAEIYRAPWGYVVIDLWVGEMLRIDDQGGSNADAEFVAHARTDVPVLLAEVERLTRLVAAMHRAARGDDAPVLLGLVDDVALTRDAFLAQQSKAATFERLLTIEKAEKKRLLTLLHDVQKIARDRGAEAKGRRIHGEELAARVAELEAERAKNPRTAQDAAGAGELS
ncbi:hypothetical protein [Actinacidiphila sp. ITFR-21]|uniref:hypothetical protein n=1 Tax=Actinacidiphila sp. ITFR-21 TaxID=3075199 RepID=UPI00288A72D1|nr:hypothetical protein [Streptomyces sp. ITFR-21]WNI15542.1 hypothetical protein RLT57_08400 [Streptomyces sp. ITFR-21]